MTTPLQPFELWGQRGWCSQEVVGMFAYVDHLRVILNAAQDMNDIQTTAYIIHEPTNRYDKNACAVWIDGGIVGYLPKEEAARYAPGFRQLAEAGIAGWCAAHIAAYQYGDEAEVTVEVDLAEPGLLVPCNAPLPASTHRELPVGKATNVLDEELHMEALAKVLAGRSAVAAYATLTRVEEGRKKPYLAVSINDLVVGRLSPAVSTSFMSLIDALATQGRTAVVRATVTGNQLSAEVKMFAVKAKDLTPRQIDDLLANPATTVEVVQEPGE